MSTANAVTDRIRTSLLRGDLAPGARLRQDRLAAELGVSKIPVREALQRLAAEGLAVFESNRGFAVRALTSAEASEIYGLRKALEPALLRRAIPRLNRVDMARAEEALEDAEAPPGESNWAFHAALYGASGWARGVAMVASLHVAVAPYLVLYERGLDAAETSARQHRSLLGHCREGSVEEAVAVLDEHLEMASSSLCAFLERARAPAGAV